MKRLKLMKKYNKMKMHHEKHEKTMLYKSQVYLLKNAMAVYSAHIDILLRTIQDKDKEIHRLKTLLNNDV